MTYLLFGIDKKQTTTKNTLTRVKCNGCDTTALVDERRGRGIFGALPRGWAFCGAMGGELARWCGQCQYERRHERYRTH